jgi:hypothetical protein
VSQARNPGTVPLDLISGSIVAITSALALIHFLLALSLGPPGLSIFPLLFYLNALGYLVLLIALYTPLLAPLRRLIRWALILYTAVTFALYFVIATHRAAEGILSVVLEGALIVVLLIDEWRAALQAKKYQRY